MEKQRKPLRGRHLTLEQREDIATGLQDSTKGPPVSIKAAASDKEAVCYEGEIAGVLEEMGCKVQIDNAEREAPEQEIPAGIEMTIKEETVQPIHAYRILSAFRRAGVVIATRINARRRKNDTLYITVGSNDALAPVPPTIRTAVRWKWKSLATLLAKWKIPHRQQSKQPSGSGLCPKESPPQSRLVEGGT